LKAFISPALLLQQAASDKCLLVDCLTLWLTNLLVLEEGAQWNRSGMLSSTYSHIAGPHILAAMKSHGHCAMGDLARRFSRRSRAG